MPDLSLMSCVVYSGPPYGEHLTLQDAVNQADRLGLSLFIPAGVHNEPSPVVLPARLRMFGYGPESRIVFRNGGSGSKGFVLGANGPFDGIELSNLSLESSDDPGATEYGLYVDNRPDATNRNLKLTNCQFSNFKVNGVTSNNLGWTEDVAIRSCGFSRIGTASHGSTLPAIGVNPGQTRRSRVSDCDFREIGAIHRDFAYYASRQNYACEFINNRTNGCGVQHFGVESVLPVVTGNVMTGMGLISDGIIFSGVTGGLIANNTIHLEHPMRRAILIQSGSSGVQVIGNMVTVGPGGNGRETVRIDGCLDVNFSGNTIIGSPGSDGLSILASLGAVMNLNVIGNTFGFQGDFSGLTNQQGDAIRVLGQGYPMTGVSIQGNGIRGWRYGINTVGTMPGSSAGLLSGMTGWKIEGNRIDCFSDSIRASYLNDSTVSGNTGRFIGVYNARNVVADGNTGGAVSMTSRP